LARGNDWLCDHYESTHYECDNIGDCDASRDMEKYLLSKAPRGKNMRINIGNRICAERKAKNLSQADLERRCGLARCRISWLEHGRAVPTIETLERIADALEIPAYRLLDDDGEPAQPTKGSSKIATNGSSGRSRNNEVRLLKELREQVSRMREDDQRLLLFIARKMAGRMPRGSVNGGQCIGRELNGEMIEGTAGGDS
jgi:transcriptional regulator with XRE-family HTH domain